jgi:hypothetical protein
MALSGRDKLLLQSVGIHPAVSPALFPAGTATAAIALAIAMTALKSRSVKASLPLSLLHRRTVIANAISVFIRIVGSFAGFLTRFIIVTNSVVVFISENSFVHL